MVLACAVIAPSQLEVVVYSLTDQKMFRKSPAMGDAVKRVISNSGYPRQQDREGKC